MTDRGGLFIGILVYSERVVIETKQKWGYKRKTNVTDASIPYTYRTMVILESSMVWSQPWKVLRSIGLVTARQV